MRVKEPYSNLHELITCSLSSCKTGVYNVRLSSKEGVSVGRLHDFDSHMFPIAFVVSGDVCKLDKEILFLVENTVNLLHIHL